MSKIAQMSDVLFSLYDISLGFFFYALITHFISSYCEYLPKAVAEEVFRSFNEVELEIPQSKNIQLQVKVLNSKHYLKVLSAKCT